MSEKQIRLAAKLYEARDGLKLLLGEAVFAHRMKEVGILLKHASETTGLGILDVAGRLAKKAKEEHEDVGAVTYLCAAVELLEPSVPRP